MVKMLEIGQSAVLLPKSVNDLWSQFYTGGKDIGRYSETERVLVSNDRLTISKMLKIQSDLIGNFEESSGDEINWFQTASVKSVLLASLFL
jgi:hypothetical protein